jgi:hypothetical protein
MPLRLLTIISRVAAASNHDRGPLAAAVGCTRPGISGVVHDSPPRAPGSVERPAGPQAELLGPARTIASSQLGTGLHAAVERISGVVAHFGRWDRSAQAHHQNQPRARTASVARVTTGMDGQTASPAKKSAQGSGVTSLFAERGGLTMCVSQATTVRPDATRSLSEGLRHCEVRLGPICKPAKSSLGILRRRAVLDGSLHFEDYSLPFGF